MLRATKNKTKNKTKNNKVGRSAPTQINPTHFAHPERTLLKVPLAVELVVHERVPAVGVHVARLLVREVAWRETADLRPCKDNTVFVSRDIMRAQYGCIHTTILEAFRF